MYEDAQSAFISEKILHTKYYSVMVTALPSMEAFNINYAHDKRGKLASAERCNVTLLTARETGHIDSLDVSMTTFKAHHNLSLIYQDMGRFGEAERK